jgi:hypothetical protein
MDDSGREGQLPSESQLFAKAVREHMHLKHVHNALEFADLREGESYEITVGGEPVNPLAHLTAHAAVKRQVEQDPLVRAAFDKVVSTGTSAHHAEHILGALLFETEWEMARAVEAGKDTEKIQKMCIHKLQKLSRESAFAKNSLNASRLIILHLNRGAPRYQSKIHISGNPFIRSSGPTVTGASA